MRRTVAATLVGAAVGLAVAPTVAASAQEAAPAARCDEGHWPATVQGRPQSFETGGAGGYYVWHDERGWHLRTTTPRRTPHLFTGTIVSSGDIKLVHQYRDEGRDSVRVGGAKLSFFFTTYTGVDGVDLVVGCTESVTFRARAGGRIVPSSRIWLGAGDHAPNNPFTIHRIG